MGLFGPVRSALAVAVRACTQRTSAHAAHAAAQTCTLALQSPTQTVERLSSRFNSDAGKLWWRFSGWRAAEALKQSAAQRQSTRQFQSLQQWPQYSRRGWNPDYALWGLIGANAAGFVAWQLDPGFMQKHAMVSINSVREGRIYTLLTHAFSHRSGMHLASNMFVLYFFGREVAYRFGGRWLFGLYGAGAVFGALCHIIPQYLEANKQGQHPWGRQMRYAMSPPALGASGAVNAVLMFTIALNPTATVLLYGIIPMPAAVLGVMYVYLDVTGAIQGSDNIGHMAHLGGAAVGLAAYGLVRRGRFRSRW